MDVLSENIKEVIREKFDLKIVFALVLVAFLIVINLLRLDFNVMWADEIVSIQISNATDDFTKWGFVDAGSHPFLYYSFHYIFVLIFGSSALTHQFFTFIFYCILLIVSLTFVRKEFGIYVSITFIILCSLTNNAWEYITEVRMYEMAAVFILLSYLSAYKVFTCGSNKSFCYLTIFSLIASFTHYYALLAIALLYVFIIADGLLIHKERKRNVLYSVIIMIICYIPWLLYAGSIMLNMAENFWIVTIPSISECLASMFSSDYGIELFVIMSIIVVVLIVRYSTCDNSSLKLKEINPMSLWLTSGFVMIIGSILIPTLVSSLFHPLLHLRYIYPVSVIAWLLFSFSVNKCVENKQTQKALSIAVIMLLLIAAVPHSFTLYEQDVKDEEDAQYAINSVGHIEDSTIYTNVMHFNGWVIQYYWPDNESITIDLNNMPEFSKSGRNYLFVSNYLDAMQVKTIQEQGFQPVLLSDSVLRINWYYFYAYELLTY